MWKENVGTLDMANLMDADILLEHMTVIALVQSSGLDSNSLLHGLTET